MQGAEPPQRYGPLYRGKAVAAGGHERRDRLARLDGIELESAMVDVAEERVLDGHDLGPHPEGALAAELDPEPARPGRPGEQEGNAGVGEVERARGEAAAFGQHDGARKLRGIARTAAARSRSCSRRRRLELEHEAPRCLLYHAGAQRRSGLAQDADRVADRESRRVAVHTDIVARGAPPER